MYEDDKNKWLQNAIDHAIATAAIKLERDLIRTIYEKATVSVALNTVKREIYTILEFTTNTNTTEDSA